MLSHVHVMYTCRYISSNLHFICLSYRLRKCINKMRLSNTTASYFANKCVMTFIYIAICAYVCAKTKLKVPLVLCM